MFNKQAAGLFAGAIVVASFAGIDVTAAPSSSAVKTARKPVSVGGAAPKVLAKEKYVYDNAGEKLDHTILKQQAQLGKYTLYEEIVDDLGLIKLKLSLGDKVVLDKSLPRWQGLSESAYGLFDPVSGARCEMKPVARDINNDGIPELMVLKDDGSAQGAVEYTFYELDGSPQLRKIYEGHLPSANFKDTDGDGVFEITVNDSNLEGWHDAARVETYYIPITLAWDGKNYAPSAKYMKKKAPTPAELKALVNKLNADIKDRGYKAPAGSKVITTSAWGEMSRLVYSGNEKSAKALFDLMYPDSVGKLAVTTSASQYNGGPKLQSRDQFWQEFMARLRKGPYASVLSQFVG